MRNCGAPQVTYAQAPRKASGAHDSPDRVCEVRGCPSAPCALTGGYGLAWLALQGIELLGKRRACWEAQKSFCLRLRKGKNLVLISVPFQKPNINDSLGELIGKAG